MQMIAIFIAFQYVIKDAMISYVHQGIVKTLRYVYKAELVERVMKLLKQDGRDTIISKNKSVMSELYTYLIISGSLCIFLLAISASSFYVSALSALFDYKFLVGILFTFIYVGAVVGITYGVLKYIMDRVVLVSEIDQQLIIFDEVRRVINDRIDTQEDE
jgi:hypothetical protein